MASATTATTRGARRAARVIEADGTRRCHPRAALRSAAPADVLAVHDGEDAVAGVVRRADEHRGVGRLPRLRYHPVDVNGSIRAAGLRQLDEGVARDLHPLDHARR